MNIYTVYRITCSTNKVYIGYTSKTPDERFKTHISCSKKPRTKFHNAIRKHTPVNFMVESLYQTYDRKHAGEVEDLLILSHDSIANGYNTARGGQGGCISLFKETPAYMTICQKLSDAHKANSDMYRENAYKMHKLKAIGMYGRTHSDEAKSKIGRVHKNKIISEDQKAKQKKTLTNTFNDPSYIHPNSGRAHGNDTKDKISKSRELLPKIACLYCGKITDVANHKRWYGDNCKLSVV